MAKEVKRAAGGATVYAGAGSPVLREAEKRKRGGYVKEEEKESEAERKREEERKRGGHVKKSRESVEGERAKGGRLDRPKRKSGGSVGADTSPLTAASRLTPAEGQKDDYKKLDREDD